MLPMIVQFPFSSVLFKPSNYESNNKTVNFQLDRQLSGLAHVQIHLKEIKDSLASFPLFFRFEFIYF